MIRINKAGFISGMAISTIGLSIVAIIALAFAAWAYNGKEKYENHADALVASAVQAERAKEAAIKDQQFKVEEQYPYQTYVGPEQYGSVSVSYPKTWSGYVDTTGADGNPVDGYFGPGVLPALTGANSIFALRLQINPQSYSSNLASYTSQQQSTNLTITPYSLKRVPSVVGVMIQGAIAQGLQGILIILPIRTVTLEIWTDSMQYANQFTNQILPSVTFNP